VLQSSRMTTASLALPDGFSSPAARRAGSARWLM